MGGYMNEDLEISELFTSLQGESLHAGTGCFFIRLSGCNLNCRYCDTRYATGGASRRMTVRDLVAAASAVRVPLIELTGGEPLLQPAAPVLLRALLGIPERTVLVETNGSLDISVIPDGAVAIVDVKGPDSGAADSFDPGNLGRLRPYDELKFVIGSRRDYEWARAFITAQAPVVRRVAAVHFSPVGGAGFEASSLAGWIVEDGLPVRLQLQLHRLLDMR
jgi:7-carboxy-7-deazaguanine synthase